MITIMGGHGFLGKHVVNELEGRKISVPTHQQCDFQSYVQIYDRIIQDDPTYIINLVGWNGGILFNKKYPIEIFTKNTEFNLNFFKAIYYYMKDGRGSIKAIITPITSCAYPNIPDMKEEKFWDGPVHESVECHGVARRTIEVQSRLLNRWAGRLFCFTPCLNNLYGPGDNFDEERSKFFAALVRKIVNAERKHISSLQMYGNGLDKREPLYVKDAAAHIVWMLDNYDSLSNNLINLSGDDEISIKELAHLIADEVGYKGEFVWEEGNSSQSSKKLNVALMRQLGITNKTSLIEGIKQTVRWYKNEH